MVKKNNIRISLQVRQTFRQWLCKCSQPYCKMVLHSPKMITFFYSWFWFFIGHFVGLREWYHPRRPWFFLCW